MSKCDRYTTLANTREGDFSYSVHNEFCKEASKIGFIFDWFLLSGYKASLVVSAIWYFWHLRTTYSSWRCTFWVDGQLYASSIFQYEQVSFDASSSKQWVLSTALCDRSQTHAKTDYSFPPWLLLQIRSRCFRAKNPRVMQTVGLSSQESVPFSSL